jgi:hypothetical protein
MKQDMSKNYYQGCGKTVKGTADQKKAVLQQYEDSKQWVAQPKCDGNWAAVHGGKTLTVISQPGKPFANHGLRSFPSGCLIIGELQRGTQEAKKRVAKAGHPFISVFDILFFDHEWLGDRTLLERQELLKAWHAKLWDTAKDYYRLLPVWTDRFVERYEKQPEGLVLKKSSNGAYHCGTKTPDWVKVKQMESWEFVLMDYTLSTATTKSHEPMCQNIIVGQFVNGVLTPMGKPGGMDHATSKEIAQNFAKYKGKVVEIEGWGRFDSGALRHPSFVKWRQDKSPEECIWDGQ